MTFKRKFGNKECALFFLKTLTSSGKRVLSELIWSSRLLQRFTDSLRRRFFAQLCSGNIKNK
jgi:hypothetical protein